MMFEASLGAWFAAHLLSEQPLNESLTGARVLSVRFETEAPVDDVLVKTDAGYLFVQAKTTVSLSAAPEGALAKTVDQFVKQFLACLKGNKALGWARPLDPTRDRLLLAVSPSTPRVVLELASGLQALSSNSTANLPDSTKVALSRFRSLVESVWKRVTGDAPSAQEVDRLMCLVSVASFDFQGAVHKPPKWSTRANY